MCILKVPRREELGPVPYFPSFQVPLPKTLPSPPKPVVTLGNPIPDDSLEPPAAEDLPQNPLPENTNIEMTVNSESAAQPNAESPALESAENSAQAPSSSTQNISNPVSRKRQREQDVEIRRSDSRTKRLHKDHPDLHPNLPRLRSSARALENDHKLAEELQRSERRRSPRKCALRFPSQQ